LAKLKGTEVRAEFLEFFAERGHTVHPSDSLYRATRPLLRALGSVSKKRPTGLGR
jgi:alanyl-tRNA synthetase